MTGRLFEINVMDVLSDKEYDTNTHQYTTTLPPYSNKFLKDDDVGIVIFSTSQKEELTKFREENYFDIIFEGPPAFNNSYLNDRAPRLFLFLIKKKSNVKDSVV